MILVGRNIVHSANDAKKIHPSAYGSVPVRTAQGVLLHKQITVDLLRQRKEAGAMLELDAV